jgi:hypothetical protein
MSLHNQIALDYSSLHHQFARTAHNAYYKHLPFVFGQDSTATTPEQKDRYNGIIRLPRGFVAQFKLNHDVFGPLILTFVTHDPDNLGTFNPATGEFVMTEDNLKGQTYLVSALPASAPFTLFQDAIGQHFKKIQAYSADLNLLGHTDYVHDTAAEEQDLLFFSFLSRHIAYGIMERTQTDYRARALLGKGRLDFETPTLTNILPQDMSEKGNGYARQVIKLMHQIEKAGWTESFPHTEAALRAVVNDWNWRVSRLWNNQNLNPSILFRVQRSIDLAFQKRLHRPLITAAIVASALEIFAGDRALTKNLMISIATAASSEFLSKFSEDAFQKVYNWFVKQSDLSHEISLKDVTARDYAAQLFDARHRDSDRPAKKIDPVYAGKIIRLKAIDDLGATDIHLPFDDVIPVDPSKTHPHDLWMANWYNEIFGNVSRMINPNSFMVRSQNGLVSVVINDPPEDKEFGKSNVTHIYTTHVDLDGKPPKLKQSHGLLGKLKAAYDSVAHATGWKQDQGNHVSYTPNYVDAAQSLNGRTKKITINRRDSMFTSEWLAPEAAAAEIIKAVDLTQRDTAPKSEKIFYGLGKPRNGERRLRRALGLPPVPELTAS